MKSQSALTKPEYRFIILALILCALAATTADAAQQGQCAPPALQGVSSDANIFSEEQEGYLGEAVAEHIQKDYRIIEDAELTRYLARIGSRLAEHLPLTSTRFQFFVVDLPDANAFVLPGGRVYVGRKLIALARSEDELAGVIGHELGHLATHETAIEMTRRLKDVLGVTSLGDRRDVFEKYNQLIDNFGRKPGAYKVRDREKGQMNADQIGFYSLVAAGYDADALARFWDRATETKGKTGGWFSDLFGTTRPEERRLREMQKALSTLPAGCISKRAGSPQAEFEQWQSAVVGYAGLGRRESLHGVVAQRHLSPPLRSDIEHLRFSPDGQYILAQDESSITVLTREPFAPVFRIEARDAKPASFSPDSQQVVFYTDNLRVERWSVAEQKLADVKEVVVRKGCLQTALSPDGHLLACLSPNLDLSLIEVASGQTLAQKKKFFLLGYWRAENLFWQLSAAEGDSTDLGIDVIKMGFSPDGKYFLAGTMGRDNISSDHGMTSFMTLDTATMQKFSMPDSIGKLILGGFAFIGNDRMVGINYYDGKKSALVTFPEGKILSEFPLGGRLASATRGELFFIRPTQKWAVGVYDLGKKVISKVSEHPAIDFYGDVFVAELRNGQVGLYHTEKSELIASAQLPDSALGSLRVGSVSPDLKWLALSSRSRGGVWNMSNGEAAFYLRGFRGAHFTDKFFYGEFPKFETAERNVARFDLASGEIVPGEKIEAETARQIGHYLVAVRPAKGEKEGEQTDWSDYRKNVRLEIADAVSSKPLWSKVFPKEAPVVWVSPQQGILALVWDVQADAAKDEIKSDPALAARMSAMKEKEGDYLIEMLDAQTGTRTGALLVETGKGSFRLRSMLSASDWVVIADTLNRVQVYSLKSGEQKGKVFGNHATVSTQRGLLCVENERGKLAIYDLGTMEKRDELIFSNPVSLASFSEDGARLFVLTSNQTAYVIDVSALGGQPTASK